MAVTTRAGYFTILKNIPKKASSKHLGRVMHLISDHEVAPHIGWQTALVIKASAVKHIHMLFYFFRQWILHAHMYGSPMRQGGKNILVIHFLIKIVLSLLFMTQEQNKEKVFDGIILWKLVNKSVLSGVVNLIFSIIGWSATPSHVWNRIKSIFFHTFFMHSKSEAHTWALKEHAGIM